MFFMHKKTKYHYLAIELKYEGKTYEEISRALKGAIEPRSIANWFNKDGLLYLDYLEYAERKNRERQAESASIFSKEVANASKVIINALTHAVKNKNDDKAVEYAKEILDRAGLVVVRRSEIKSESKPSEPMTYEEFIAECERQGIDPSSGVRKTAAEMVKN